MFSRDQPISPRYTPCILISRIVSALPHRVNSQETNSVDYVVYSRSHAFHDGNQTLRRKNPNPTGIEPSFFPPRGGRRTSTPPGHRTGSIRYFQVSYLRYQRYHGILRFRYLPYRLDQVFSDVIPTIPTIPRYFDIPIPRNRSPRWLSW